MNKQDKQAARWDEEKKRDSDFLRPTAPGLAEILRVERALGEPIHCCCLIVPIVLGDFLHLQYLSHFSLLLILSKILGPTLYPSPFVIEVGVFEKLLIGRSTYRS